MSGLRIFILGAVFGFFLWILFILAVVFLQISGLILNKIVYINFGDGAGWDPLIAIGAVLSAFSATVAAIIALVLDNRNRTERDVQRRASAQAKRATAAIALSELCSYFSSCAQEYEKFFPYLKITNANEGYVHIDRNSFTESSFGKISIPYRAINVLEETLEFFPEHMKAVAEAVSVIQVTNSRMSGLKRDVEILNAGMGFGLFSQIFELAEAYGQISDLFDWARFRPIDRQNHLAKISFNGLRLQIANEQQLNAWRDRTDNV